MAGQSTATIDFGAYPGTADTSVAVAQTGILAGSLVEAWIYPVATTDHSADEHWIDPPVVTAGNVSAGVGFTIYATAAPNPETWDRRRNRAGENYSDSDQIERGRQYYGQYTVAWVWN
jgi:hypothetical protein